MIHAVFYTYRVVYKYGDIVYRGYQHYKTQDVEEAKKKFLDVLLPWHRPGIVFLEFEMIGEWGGRMSE